MADPNVNVVLEWGTQNLQSHPIQGAMLETKHCTYTLKLLDTNNNNNKNNNNVVPSIQKTQIMNNGGNCSTSPSSSSLGQLLLSHDQEKRLPLSNDADFFQHLGVTDSDGKPRPGMKSKVRKS
jgi:hypothetical protein